MVVLKAFCCSFAGSLIMELNFDCTSHMFTVMVNSDIFNADIFKGKQSGNDRDSTWLVWNIAKDCIFWIHCCTAALIADGAAVCTRLLKNIVNVFVVVCF